MRTILLGLHNPHSTDPAAALGLEPPNASGARLFKMFQEAAAREGTFVSERSYLDGFERMNLMPRLDMSKNRFDARKSALCSYIKERVIVMLGTQVPDKLGLPRNPDFNVQPLRSRCMEFTYYVLPHPSGANRVYNDPEVVQSTGDLLLKLWKAGNP